MPQEAAGFWVQTTVCSASGERAAQGTSARAQSAFRDALSTDTTATATTATTTTSAEAECGMCSLRQKLAQRRSMLRQYDGGRLSTVLQL
mmetsp:Transcript_1280/g.3944  ORF Transcript_1280/g.3944 Transcript_1280/m.3944 type:complete len:90 (+) Transcript_1280:236-505(+)